MRDRGIIGQIKMWDRFDHSGDPWQDDPFNPKNKINYDEDESGLAPDYPQHPGQNQRPLFYTVLGLEGNQVILKWQQAFVDRILSFAFQYDHVLYCVDNETSGDPAWGRYWATYITQAAEEEGLSIQVTEMCDQWDVRHETHRATFDEPSLFQFVDISQNSHTPGEPN